MLDFGGIGALVFEVLAVGFCEFGFLECWVFGCWVF